MKTFEVLNQKLDFYNLLIQCAAKLLKFLLDLTSFCSRTYLCLLSNLPTNFLGYTHQIRITFVTLKKIK